MREDTVSSGQQGKRRQWHRIKREKEVVTMVKEEKWGDNDSWGEKME